MSKDVLGETEAAIWSEMCDNCTNYVLPANQRHPLSLPPLAPASTPTPSTAPRTPTSLVVRVVA